MKRFLAVIAVSVLSAAYFPNSADAYCMMHSALPIRVDVNISSAKIYFRPHIYTNNGNGPIIATHNPALRSNHWWAIVPTTTSAGAAIVDAATDAVTHQTKVALMGDAATCPAAAANGSIGNVVKDFVLNP